MLLVPCIVILWVTGLPGVWWSIGASAVLGVMGTAVATILFYWLIKRTGGLFASMVTYGIPFVALFWGVLAGEKITVGQVVGLAVILVGVYITTRWKSEA
jgi:drug/metabolite transporter (DMT)-like permease